MYKTYANSVSEKNKCLPYGEDAFVITNLHIFYFSLKKTLLSSTMVFIRSILNELSKDKLIEAFLSFDNSSANITDLTKKMGNLKICFRRSWFVIQKQKIKTKPKRFSVLVLKQWHQRLA